MRLHSRIGHTFGVRFPLIVAAVMALPARPCLLGGEMIVSDASGLNCDSRVAGGSCVPETDMPR